MSNTDKRAIKEMAQIICLDKDHQGDCDRCCYYDERSRLRCSSVSDAEKLYAKGYRKQSGFISAKTPPKVYRDEDGDLELFIAYSSKHDCMALAIFNGDRWYLGPHELDDVDYWMPLPEPPKGET